VSNTMNVDELVDQVILIFVEVVDQPFGAHACGARFKCCAFNQLGVVVDANPGYCGEAAGIDVV
jgi:hypothetical protein